MVRLELTIQEDGFNLGRFLSNRREEKQERREPVNLGNNYSSEKSTPAGNWTRTPWITRQTLSTELPTQVIVLANYSFWSTRGALVIFMDGPRKRITYPLLPILNSISLTSPRCRAGYPHGTYTRNKIRSASHSLLHHRISSEHHCPSAGETLPRRTTSPGGTL